MSEIKEIDREKLADLLAKVKAATEPSGDIEIDLCLALNYIGSYPFEPVNLRLSNVDDGWLDYEADEDGDGRLLECTDKPPELTASIDAALALVEKVLGVDAPALCYSYDLGWHCYAHAEMAFTADLHVAVGNPADMRTSHGQGASLPLAILAALLTALTEKP